jgi:hypothetical protein
MMRQAFHWPSIRTKSGLQVSVKEAQNQRNQPVERRAISNLNSRVKTEKIL